MFNDNIRNAIKGAEFGGFQHGFVQGTYTDNNKRDLSDEICKGLTGSSNLTQYPGRSLNYVECHDNYTLFDKLAMSYLGETERKSSEGNLLQDLIDATSDKIYSLDDVSTDITALEMVKAQNKMCAAIIFLAQGTPFINGGQEFMRTKQGDENSYISDDSINQIDLTLKTTFNDVYKVYKGLITLRKSSTAFTAGRRVVASTLKSGFTKYITTGTDASYCVYFNATAEEQTIDTTGYTKAVDVTSGVVTESTTLPATVAAKSFVILKK